jgi:hypothetical protein
MMKKYFPLLMAIAILLLPAFASACPLCKDTIAQTSADTSPFGGGISGGFNHSIYFMFVGFFACLGLAGGVITKGVLNTNRRMKPPKN